MLWRIDVSSLAGLAILPTPADIVPFTEWRTKKGAIEVMGNMAYLAPRQLSISLPTIIPHLTEVLTDTHTQVRTSANASLKKFGEVVDNPEIKAMQSTLLGALVDPTAKTLAALNALLTTSFVHYIDASSLALIVPIIERGLRERSAELKRKAAQIVGNLASLTDSKDIISYLPQLVPRVREVLVDPVPEARATAAKSLGILIERLGEDAFPTLVSDLMDTLKSDMSGVDQQGAAQGLSEVLAGLGVERMESMLPEIIGYTSAPRAYIREGFISLLIYLPSVFGDRFSPYLGKIIQPVLSGLADESEFVREGQSSHLKYRAVHSPADLTLFKSFNACWPHDCQQSFDQGYRSSSARARARLIRSKLAHSLVLFATRWRASVPRLWNQWPGRNGGRQPWRRRRECATNEFGSCPQNVGNPWTRQERSRSVQSIHPSPGFSWSSPTLLPQCLESIGCQYSTSSSRDAPCPYADGHSPACLLERGIARDGCENSGRVC
jgi:hypothetical protein